MTIFETQDFYLCAFLSSAGFPIINFQRNDGLTTFAFEQRAELSKLVRDYYADQANISPIRYGNSLKNLKSLIHSNHYERTNMHNERAAK